MLEAKTTTLPFLDLLPPAGTQPAWLQNLRHSARTRYEALGLPTPRTEDWKYTSVAPLLRTQFRAPPASARPTATALTPYTFADSCQLVFVNGSYAPELSRVPQQTGVVVANLATVMQQQPQLVEPHLGRYARHEELAFTALNTANLQDGAVVLLKPGVVLTTPIHIVHVALPDGAPTVSMPRSLIVAEAGSQLTVVESYLGLQETAAFTNAVTEIAAGPDCVLDHYKILREPSQATHFANTQVTVARNSNFASHFIALGGGLVRNEVRALFAGEHAECTLNGMYLGRGAQHIDNHTVIDHALPNCASHELYKGLLDERAHGVFNGKIFVRQDAQKTDAKQTNQTLLLSDEATIDTKPQLEIYADDVKCTHGATVGRLNDEMLFYLRSRGLGVEQARNLLIFAFANDIVRRIKVEPIRAQLEEVLLTARNLPRLGDLAEEQ